MGPLKPRKRLFGPQSAQKRPFLAQNCHSIFPDCNSFKLVKRIFFRINSQSLEALRVYFYDIKNDNAMVVCHKFRYYIWWQEISITNHNGEYFCERAERIIPWISFPSIPRSHFVSFRNVWKFGICVIAAQMSSSRMNDASCLGNPTQVRVSMTPFGPLSAFVA